MRLTHRQRHNQRRRRSLITISEAEISADLHYPGLAPEQRRGQAGRRLGGK
jgi:hypothetical protein